MNNLSLWEMMWQLGTLCCVAVPIVIIVGMTIFAIFKPLQTLDNL